MVRFKYRFDGKEKRLSLGVFPDVALTKGAQVIPLQRRTSMRWRQVSG